MQRPGIEPGPPAWQARILPLNQRCLLMIATSDKYEPSLIIRHIIGETPLRVNSINNFVLCHITYVTDKICCGDFSM